MNGHFGSSGSFSTAAAAKLWFARPLSVSITAEGVNDMLVPGLVVTSLISGSVAVSSVDALPQTLQTISTVEELEQLEPLHLGGGCHVRVGLSDGGPAAGPWRLLYCPAGIEQLTESRMKIAGAAQRIGRDEAVPLLSNRLEIVVSQGMLAERP